MNTDNPYQSPESATPPDHTNEEDVVSNEHRTWAVLCHLGALSWYIGIPGFVTTLALWLLKKDESRYIDEQGKESLNFQITILIAFVLSLFTICLAVVGVFITWGVLGIYNVVMIIIAALKTSNGEHFRYPLTWRIIK